MRRLAVLVLCVAVLATLLPAVEAAGQPQVTKRNVKKGANKKKTRPVSVAALLPQNHRDFWSVECRSAAYELSISSFASVWMILNAVTLIVAFGVFLKHWCYKAFTDETAKGY